MLSTEGEGDAFYEDDTVVRSSGDISVLASAYGIWHSGALSSVDQSGAGFAQRYGYFEARVQMPQAGSGSWPAWWLMTNNFSDEGVVKAEEVDVFEHYGNNYSVANSCGVAEASHNWNNGVQDENAPYLDEPCTPIPDHTKPWDAFHTYGFKSDPVYLTWYIDGIQVNRIHTPSEYVTAPFYMMLNYALGGGWPLTGMANPSFLYVDWLRVYALPASFAVGAPVQALGRTVPYTKPGDQLACSVGAETFGTIMREPLEAGGATWWQVAFTTGCSGFVAQSALAVVTQ